MTDNPMEPIQPVDVPLTQSASQQPTKPRYWYQNKFTVIALAACVALVIAVIFLLPKYISPVATQAVDVEVIDTTITPAESPFQQQQTSKARREAQDILDKLLEKQTLLETKQVNFWAKAAFMDALELASNGDSQYRQRKFSSAITQYQQADHQLQQLIDSIPNLLTDHLKNGLLAIEQNNAKLAKNHFDIALLLDPDNASALKGQQRSENLDKVLALMNAGQQAEKTLLTEPALQFYQQAFELDPDYTQAQTAITRLRSQLDQQNFLALMGQGYDALESGDNSKARQFFGKALAINPNDEAANNALNQATNQATRNWLNNHLTQAKKFEQLEQWQQAVTTYQKIIDRDASIIDAKIGQLKANARATLDGQIEKIINNPLRLATHQVFIAAQQTLKDARAIIRSGPRLTQQIEQLQTVLTHISKPQVVNFVSDNATQVTLYKVGDLGQFSQKQLSLKPGKYIAVGSRNGYRDVRVEFEVNTSTPVEIICREPIS